MAANFCLSAFASFSNRPSIPQRHITWLWSGWFGHILVSRKFKINTSHHLVSPDRAFFDCPRIFISTLFSGFGGRGPILTINPLHNHRSVLLDKFVFQRCQYIIYHCQHIREPSSTSPFHSRLHLCYCASRTLGKPSPNISNKRKEISTNISWLTIHRHRFCYTSLYSTYPTPAYLSRAC